MKFWKRNKAGLSYKERNGLITIIPCAILIGILVIGFLVVVFTGVSLRP